MLAAHGVTADLDGWEAKDAASAYEVRGGSLGWHRPVKDGGTLWTPLATFDAEITDETVRDDGAEQTLTWAVRVTTADGRTGEVLIPPDQLGKPQQWAAKAAGISALVMPGLSVADQLRVAVQSRSTSVTRRTVYAHTGWRLIDGHWMHLTSSGALGAMGLDDTVTVDLGSLGGYALPPVPDVRAVREAVRESLALIGLAPDTVTVPLARRGLPRTAAASRGLRGVDVRAVRHVQERADGAGAAALRRRDARQEPARELDVERQRP